MAHGSIENALLLLYPNYTPGDPDQTYWFATTVPSYAQGQQFQYSLTASGPKPYTFQNSHFLSIASFDNIAFASRLFLGMDRVSTLFFTQGSNENADIVVFGTNQTLYQGNDPALGFAVPPSGPAGIRQDVILTPSGVNDYQATFAHEVMHSVGIRDSVGILPGGPNGEDNARYTIMSYNAHPDEGRFALDPQLYDVAALQALWGNGTAGLGDTMIDEFVELSGPDVGKDRMFAIWDGSGTDTIDASSVTKPTLIDLRPGYFSSIGPDSIVNITAGMTPAVVNQGRLNISIAFGTYIENAKGTSDEDLIIGNLLSNKLEGGAGADVLYGEGVDSVHDAGDGEPSYRRITTTGTHIENAPNSIKAFVDDKTKQQDHLLGGAGDDHLRGGRGDDLIEGGADDDYIIGGGGNDEIWGGDKDQDQGSADGTDTVDYNAFTGGITIHFDGAGATPTITVSGASVGTDTLHSIEVIKATEYSDRFEYIGVLPGNYALTVDLAGGVDSVGPYVDLGGADAGMHYQNGEIRNNEGDTSGVIHLQNVSTMISGSRYDDEITDEAEGEKHIYGGEGDDEITVGNGDAVIRGGLGDDRINGGDGNDILRGEWGTDIVHGGEGSDLVANFRIDLELLPGVIIEDSDELYGDEGADYLLAMALSWGATLVGGAGNDVIDAREAREVTVRFGAGDGHDMILSDREIGVEYEVGEEPYDGVSLIDMTSISKSEVTILWNPTHLIEDVPPNGDPTDIPGYLYRQGDLVIRIDATGDTILVRNIRGTTTYWEDPAEASQPPFDGMFDFIDLHEINDMVQFADGPITYEDYLGANPVVSLQFGSVAQYATALDEYLEATAADPEENEGTSGDDDMRGSRGDDAIDGGEGDDSFHGSGGEDSIDGGAGLDQLILFGARAAFAITRDAATGDVTLEDKTKLEGKITVKSVEKIYFATDNQAFAPGDLVGFWGTGNDDALVEGNERDNLIHGLAGNDLLRGLAGNDTLDGGAGADTLAGGAGNDYYVVDSAGDTIIEAVGEGYDVVLTSVGYALAAGTHVEALSTADWASTAALDLNGNEFTNAIYGNAGFNTLDGGGGNDYLIGMGGSDYYVVDSAGDAIFENANEGYDVVLTSVSYALGAGTHVEALSTADWASTASLDLTGNELANALYGNAGSNVLNGGNGNDYLIGLGGADIFAFTTALGGGNVDTITDFVSGTDRIALDDAVFSALSPGALSANAFVIGTAAGDADDRILYDQATGRLYYDADGNGSGAAMLFATLEGAPLLTAGDFTVT